MVRFCITFLFTATVASSATLYAIVDLGAPALPANLPGVPSGTLPGGSWSAIYGSNGSGDYAGYGDTADGHFRAFVWSASSGMKVLGTLGGADSWAMALNEEEAVAGHSTTASGFIHAFVEENGHMFDLGTLGGESSYAYGINEFGVVVGYSVTPDGNEHAFITNGGSMTDLNSLVSRDSGWLLTAAYSIDDAGRITGAGIFNGAMREYRLDPLPGALSALNASLSAPVPEPSTMIVTGAALALLARILRTSRG